MKVSLKLQALYDQFLPSTIKCMYLHITEASALLERQLGLESQKYFME